MINKDCDFQYVNVPPEGFVPEADLCKKYCRSRQWFWRKRGNGEDSFGRKNPRVLPYAMIGGRVYVDESAVKRLVPRGRLYE